MNGNINTEFNGQSAAPQKWREESYVALAKWWADQLPGAQQLGIPEQERENIGGSVQMAQATSMKAQQRKKMEVTQEQYDAFTTALVDEMKQLKPSQGSYVKMGMITLDTDYNPCQALASALSRAGIGDGMITLPWKTSSSLFEDGQAFAQGKAIDYPGRPAIPAADAKDLDFEGCGWYRNESRYLVIDLPPGQKVITGQRIWGKMEYREEIAAEGQVLVIPAYAARDFDSLVAGPHLFDQSKHDDFNFAMIDPKTDYTGPEGKYGQTFDKVDDEGHYRSLDKPFRARQATRQFFIGAGSSYNIVEPGDFVTCTGKGREARHEVVRKSWIEEGARRWLHAAEDGTLIDPAQTGAAVKIGKPLQLKTPAG